MVVYSNGDVKAEATDINSSEYEINMNAFRKRLEAFYSNWRCQKRESWGGAEAITVATPPTSEDLRYLKSSALQIWLMGCELPETIMIFMETRIHVLCMQDKVSFLADIKETSTKLLGIDVFLHVKAENDDGNSQMQEIFQSIQSHCTMDPPVIGWIAKEGPEGQVLERWVEALKNTGFQLVDVTGGFSELFAQKDEIELTNIKNASFLSASVLSNYVVPKLEDIIEEEKKVTHFTLMEDTEIAILDPTKVNVKLKAENVDICYPPIFQSGGEFDLKADAESNDEYLYYDATGVIICSIGSRYNGYCSNISRTYLIDADKVQEKAYKVLLRAHEAAIMSLRPGNTAAAAYKSAFEIVHRDGPEFLAHLTKNAGTGIGIEFRETGLNLNARNERVLKSGMVFNVSLGFHNLRLQSNNPKTQFFSLLLSDTVIVNDEGPYNATCTSSKTVSDVLYFNDDEEEPEKKPKPNVEANGMQPINSNTMLGVSKHEITEEESKGQHHADLAREKNEETAKRLSAGGPDSGDRQDVLNVTGELVAYKNVDDIPSSRELMIQVDHKNDAVLLPIYGLMVPFHISTIKSVSSQQDGDNSYIHMVLNMPEPGSNLNDTLFLKSKGCIYMKEATYRSKDARHVNQVVQLIQKLMHKFSSRVSEKCGRATLITPEKLKLSKTKPIRFSGLWIRPSFGVKVRKIIGTLEAHPNSFHYSTARQEDKVDVMYRNIKHAIFQQADKEIITLIHFHLHDHIRVGNKKTKDVQFYAEVMDVDAASSAGRRSKYDPAELEEEQKGGERRKKSSAEFNIFVKRISELWEQPNLKDLKLKFDIPCKDLGFFGVPYKTFAFIVPTGNCLVELIKFPFLVITLSDIEIVNLERVGMGQKDFDMVVIFKDFKQEVFRIDAIPSAQLDSIKLWLHSKSIRCYESKINLNWRPILQIVLEDPKEFMEDGGWEFLNLDISDSDSDNFEEYEGHHPSEIEESELNKTDSYNASVVGSDEDMEAEDSEEDEEKTLDEQEAGERSQHKERGNDSENDGGRQYQRLKSVSKARLPNIRNSTGIPAKRPKFK